MRLRIFLQIKQTQSIGILCLTLLSGFVFFSISILKHALSNQHVMFIWFPVIIDEVKLFNSNCRRQKEKAETAYFVRSFIWLTRPILNDGFQVSAAVTLMAYVHFFLCF